MKQNNYTSLWATRLLKFTIELDPRPPKTPDLNFSRILLNALAIKMRACRCVLWHAQFLKWRQAWRRAKTWPSRAGASQSGGAPKAKIQEKWGVGVCGLWEAIFIVNSEA